MNNKELCGQYFRKQKELERCFSLMRKKWESYGRTAGRIELKNCTAKERQALASFFGQAFSEQEVSFSLKAFEEALQETRFAPITLEELLSEYYGESMCSNQQRRQEKQRRKKNFYEKGRACFRENEKNSWALHWIDRMEESREYGYALLNRELEREEENALALLISTGKGLTQLEELQGEAIHLAVLAAQVTGNPHYFDRGQTAGVLLIHALCAVTDCTWPATARELAELFWKNGIRMDDISSTVTIYGLHLETKHGLHPAYEGFIRERESCVVTLENLERVQKVYGTDDRVFIVENEMVFSHLTERLRGFPVSLACTSGQIRTAGIVLIERLVQNGAQIYYSGDLDPEGMDIADRLWKKYPDAIQIWRMSEEDYQSCKSDEEISAKRMVLLNSLQNPQLAATARLVKKAKKAGYQEGLLREMESDIREKFCRKERNGGQLP